MTVPQIILLNHAASVNSARMKSRMDKGRAQKVEDENDPTVWKGKRLSQLNTEETMAYMSS